FRRSWATNRSIPTCGVIEPASARFVSTSSSISSSLPSISIRERRTGGRGRGRLKMDYRRFRTPFTAGLLTVVYFISGKLSLKLAFLYASASPVWPPAGVALAALLLLGYRVWPAIFVGAFLV